MKNNANQPENTLIFTSRDSLLKTNADLIDILQKRINVKRFRPQEGDGIKLGYIRALIQALQAHNTFLKDTELEDLKKEIDELKDLLKS